MDDKSLPDKSLSQDVVFAERADLLIKPSGPWPSVGFGELWKYRELLFFLAWRDVKVRYKQTTLGVLWVVLQPLALLAVLTLVFARYAGLPSDGVPYPLYAICGLVPWLFFAGAVNQTAPSLVQERPLISKIYFPRLVLPIASLGVGLIDLLIGLVLTASVCLWYGVVPSARWLLLPVAVGGLVMVALSVGMLLAALTAKYRDFQYVVPFIVQLGLFTTPVFYSPSVVPEAYRTLYSVNPMVGILSAFRWVFIGTDSLDVEALAIAGAVVAVIFVVGLIYFRHVERTLVDWI